MSELNVSFVGGLSVEDLRGILHEGAASHAYTRTIASGIREKLEDYFQVDIHTDSLELTPELFERFFDPDAPTIALDAQSLVHGGELLGVAAHEPETRANIIYISSLTNDACIFSHPSGTGYIEVRSGVIVLPDGRTAFGTLPAPLRADIFSTGDSDLLAQLDQHGVHGLDTTCRTEGYEDKRLFEKIGENPAYYTPRRLSRDELMERKDVSNLVIKPSKMAQGNGVLLTDEDAQSQSVKDFYLFLEAKGYEPLIEERARSRKILDPETGERLDWNARALFSSGSLLGMYIRADLWGKPVNLSRTARALSVDEFAGYFDSQDEANMVIQRLRDAAEAIASEHPHGFIGGDMTVDEQLAACVFELNGGNSGGMQTIAKLGQTYDAKMELPRRFLQGVLARHTPHTPEAETPYAAGKRHFLRPSFTLLSYGLDNSPYYRQLGRINIEEIPRGDKDRAGAVLALVALREYTYRGWEMVGQLEVDQILAHEYTLEVRPFLRGIITDMHEKESLQAFMRFYDGFPPDDEGVLAIQFMTAAKLFDLEQLKKTYESADDPRGLIQANKDFLFDRFNALASYFACEREDLKECVLWMIEVYCESGYSLTAERLDELAGLLDDKEEMHRFVKILQFCVAEAAGEYQAALERADEVLQIQSGDPWQFRDFVGEYYYPICTPEEMSDYSARFAFGMELTYRMGTIMPLTLDSVALMRQPEVMKKSSKRVITQLIADLLPIQATAPEREAFKADLVKITEGDKLPILLSAAGPLAYLALLIEAVFDDSIKDARELLGLLSEVLLQNDDDYVRDMMLEKQYISDRSRNVMGSFGIRVRST